MLSRFFKYIVCKMFSRPIGEVTPDDFLVMIYDQTNDLFYYVPYSSISGGGGDLDPLVFPAGGTLGALKAYFSGDTNTGWYQNAPDSIAMVLGGLAGATFTKAGSTVVSSLSTVLTNGITFQAAQANTQPSLTAGATIDINPAINAMQKVTLDQDSVLNNPLYPILGTFVLEVTQDGTGGWELSFDSDYIFPGGTPPTITPAIGAVDILTFMSTTAGIVVVQTPNVS